MLVSGATLGWGTVFGHSRRQHLGRCSWSICRFPGVIPCAAGHPARSLPTRPHRRVRPGRGNGHLGHPNRRCSGNHFQTPHFPEEREPHLQPHGLALLISIPAFGTGQSWWGGLGDANWPCLLVILIGGACIVETMNRFPLVLGFFGTYFSMLTGIALLAAPAVAEMFRPPFVNAAIFFGLFMLTDPPTAPGRPLQQVIIGMLAAIVSIAAHSLGLGESYLLIGLITGMCYWRSSVTAPARQCSKLILWMTIQKLKIWRVGSSSVTGPRTPEPDAAIAGVHGRIVDSMSYFGFERVFTAAMTGNTVLLALAIAQGDPPAALRSGLRFLALLAAWLWLMSSHCERGFWRPWARLGAFSLSSSFSLAWLSPGRFRLRAVRSGPLLLIVLAAAAMGIQSIAVREMGQAVSQQPISPAPSPNSPPTPWTGCAECSLTHAPAEALRRAVRLSLSGPWLSFLIWLTYALGAITGGFGMGRLGGIAALGPCVTVGLSAWCAYRLGILSR